MDKILDMIAKWDALGQGFFFFFLFVLTCGVVMTVTKLFVVLFRGWPPCDDAEEIEEETPTTRKQR